MKLEEKFFQVFFYQFLVSIILCILAVSLILYCFTNNNIDRSTKDFLIKLSKKNVRNIINTAKIIIKTKIQKFQSGFNELILFYQKIAKKLLDSNSDDLEFNDYYIKNLLTLDIEYYCDILYNETKRKAFWFSDESTTENDLDEKLEIKYQLMALSNIIPNLDSIVETTKPYSYAYFFYFEKNELYISYPISDGCDSNYLYYMIDPYYTGSSCINNEGEYYEVYKLKCEIFFQNMMKSKTSVFDNNCLSNNNKTIFIANYYDKLEYEFLLEEREFSMCIEFDDPITKGKGYACVDTRYTETISSLEQLNSKLPGYFFVSNVGFNNLFYFPRGKSTPKSSTEQIYDWDLNFKLNEKINFQNNIRKVITSNYIDYINNTNDDEIFINGKNDTGQSFIINEEEFKYSLYPIIIENLNGQKEHIMSVIYVYNDNLLLNKIKNINTSFAIKIKIILEIMLYIIFGDSLFYIIYLTFNKLSKYIIIPIKNVTYMLKGIHIGGKNRLKYLAQLYKKRNENLEKLETTFLNEKKKDINNKIDETAKDLFENSDNDEENLKSDLNIKVKNSNSIIGKIKSFLDISKIYDEENDFIEKELDFYDFDEQLLQYRCKEINYLINTLLDLKGAMILTSKDRKLESIINYSYSEATFRNFKNKEGAIICQSNIGNLQCQLLKFDKAIYHLALSLQDNKLKKFLSKNLSDEFDEDNSLFNKIFNKYNKNKNNTKMNILIDKQMNNSKINFPQKKIGILINTRYCRLIHAYYMFFKNIKKLKKSNNNNIISGHFMNTLFHTISYYHKILIQYIFLSYIKNDFVKIGESILDYIEFLIKFKFKTLKKDKYFLSIHNKGLDKYKAKQQSKKKIFDKIINWFNLFDEYISYIKEFSSLDYVKYFTHDYSLNLNSESFDLNLESQTVFMFKINIQRSKFLKGKFSLCCKNYNDALFYFINSAKKKTIVTDGLIKKRSLKHIYKLLTKMKKKLEKFGLINLNIKAEFEKFQTDKNQINNKKIEIEYKYSNMLNRTKEKNNVTFSNQIEALKEDLLRNIEELNAKKEKDIIILIDFNIYNKKEKDAFIKSSNLDSIFEETLTILNNYLSGDDRFCLIIYSDKYQLICPLMKADLIDNESFSKDLINYKNKVFNKTKENGVYNINFEEIKDKDIIFNLEGNNIGENSEEEDSSEVDEEGIKNYDKIIGLVKTINFLTNYIKMKKETFNEKYLILFSELFNRNLFQNDQVEKILGNLNGDKEIILLLIMNNKNFNSKSNCTFLEKNNSIENFILNKFRENSELINFDNINKIKTILSNNKVIKEQIIYPNEIFK